MPVKTQLQVDEIGTAMRPHQEELLVEEEK